MKMFVHIPRTGGTSLRYVFRQWYGDKMFTVYEKDAEYNTDGYGIAYGHFYLDDMDYIMFLREPYQQELSYYNYTQEYTDLPDVNEYFRNAKSSMLPFLPPIKSVKFVGIYERYEEDIKRLADFLGKEYIEPRKTNTSKHLCVPSGDAIDEFKKNNGYIYELYDSYI